MNVSEEREMEMGKVKKKKENKEEDYGKEFIYRMLNNEKQGSTPHSRYISNKVRNIVWNRDRGRCIKCEGNINLEFDHIIPFSKGGSSTARNIQLLCSNCNRKKSSKI